MKKRLIIYFSGMVSVSLGIVLCAQCGLGISPISSIPFVIKELCPLTFGTLTMLFHLINISLQMILMKRVNDIKVLLQIPVAFMFGWLIDLIKTFITVDQSSLLMKALALAFSIFFTAFGMVLMVHMNLVQNPPDGFVKISAEVSKKEFGNVKIMYDVCCVLISVGIGMIFLHKPFGMGIATLASALLVGRLVTILNKILGKRLIGQDFALKS